MQSFRYVLLSLALGLIAVWGSEMFFWSFPSPGFSGADWLATWIAYALCCAAVLSAVAWSGLGGLTGLFLGGALLGLLTEGVVVGTMYEGFPFQLVWTPLAWHALVTAVCVLGLGRAGPHWPLWRQVAALLALGGGGAFFALFWSLDPDRAGTIPGGDQVLFYLVGIGLGVVVGNVILGRIAAVPRPPVWVLLLAPGLAAAFWVAQSVADPSPVRLAFVLMVGLTLWAMRRLGAGGSVGLGPVAPVWRHALFLIAPLTMTLIIVPIWQAGGSFEANWVVAGITVPVSLGWWLWLLWRAARQPRKAASAADKSIAPS
jgi:hypothetical protein